jgi:hypothetical protein
MERRSCNDRLKPPPVVSFHLPPTLVSAGRENMHPSGVTFVDYSGSLWAQQRGHEFTSAGNTHRECVPLGPEE